MAHTHGTCARRSVHGLLQRHATARDNRLDTAAAPLGGAGWVLGQVGQRDLFRSARDQEISRAAAIERPINEMVPRTGKEDSSMDGTLPSISPPDLADMIGTATAPIVVDVRAPADLVAID